LIDLEKNRKHQTLFLDVVVLPISIMQRLADYFLVVGYDHDEERGGRSCGKIIQRFPDKDWPDCPFNPRIIHFCQPQGWILTPKHELPTFFISILTDLDGLRHYCACLTFHQTLLPTTITTTNTLLNKTNGCSDEADDTAFLIPRTQMYAPKCLVLTSKLDCFEAFRVNIIRIEKKRFLFIYLRIVLVLFILCMSKLRQIFELKQLLVIFLVVLMSHHQVCSIRIIKKMFFWVRMNRWTCSSVFNRF
jgi:hypothetical protein